MALISSLFFKIVTFMIILCLFSLSSVSTASSDDQFKKPNCIDLGSYSSFPIGAPKSSKDTATTKLLISLGQKKPDPSALVYSMTKKNKKETYDETEQDETSCSSPLSPSPILPDPCSEPDSPPKTETEVAQDHPGPPSQNSRKKTVLKVFVSALTSTFAFSVSYPFETLFNRYVLEALLLNNTSSSSMASPLEYRQSDLQSLSNGLNGKYDESCDNRKGSEAKSKWFNLSFDQCPAIPPSSEISTVNFKPVKGFNYQFSSSKQQSPPSSQKQDSELPLSAIRQPIIDISKLEDEPVSVMSIWRREGIEGFFEGYILNAAQNFMRSLVFGFFNEYLKKKFRVTKPRKQTRQKRIVVVEISWYTWLKKIKTELYKLFEYQIQPEKNNDQVGTILLGLAMISSFITSTIVTPINTVIGRINIYNVQRRKDFFRFKYILLQSSFLSNGNSLFNLSLAALNSTSVLDTDNFRRFLAISFSQSDNQFEFGPTSDTHSPRTDSFSANNENTSEILIGKTPSNFNNPPGPELPVIQYQPPSAPTETLIDFNNVSFANASYPKKKSNPINVDTNLVNPTVLPKDEKESFLEAPQDSKMSGKKSVTNGINSKADVDPDNVCTNSLTFFGPGHDYAVCPMASNDEQNIELRKEKESSNFLTSKSKPLKRSQLNNPIEGGSINLNPVLDDHKIHKPSLFASPENLLKNENEDLEFDRLDEDIEKIKMLSLPSLSWTEYIVLIFRVVYQLTMEEESTALFSGLSAAILLAVNPAFSSCVYDVMDVFFQGVQSTDDISYKSVAFAAAVSKAIGTLVAYPANVLKNSQIVPRNQKTSLDSNSESTKTSNTPTPTIESSSLTSSPSPSTPFTKSSAASPPSTPYSPRSFTSSCKICTSATPLNPFSDSAATAPPPTQTPIKNSPPSQEKESIFLPICEFITGKVYITSIFQRILTFLIGIIIWLVKLPIQVGYGICTEGSNIFGKYGFLGFYKGFLAKLAQNVISEMISKVLSVYIEREILGKDKDKDKQI